MTDLVQTHHRDAIFEIVLNRPEKRNAINLEMLQGLDRAVLAAMRAPGVRVVWLRGAGPSFSAGIDLAAFMAIGETYGTAWARHMRRVTDDFQAVFTRLERLELPTLALLQGHCLGLGLELALACDVRLAAQGTRLGLPETRLGLIPDVGGSTRLARLVGISRAKELIFTGRQIEAAQAEAWGMVNAVTPLDALEARAAALSAEIEQAAPLAVGMAKRVLDGMADLDRGLQLEGWAQSQLIQTQDFQEGVQSFLQRRPPHFTGR